MPNEGAIHLNQRWITKTIQQEGFDLFRFALSWLVVQAQNKFVAISDTCAGWVTEFARDSSN